MIYVHIAAIGACCAVLAYFILDKLWPEPKKAAPRWSATAGGPPGADVDLRDSVDEPQWLK